MERLEELSRTLCQTDGLDPAEWPSRMRHAEACLSLFDRWAPYLMPTTSNCPACGTVRVVSAPYLGTCEECGDEMIPTP